MSNSNGAPTPPPSPTPPNTDTPPQGRLIEKLPPATLEDCAGDYASGTAAARAQLRAALRS